MTAGRGFIAIAIVIFALWSPGRAIVGSLLFSAAVALGIQLQAQGSPVSPFLLDMLPYLVTIAVVLTWGRAEGVHRPGRAPRGFRRNVKMTSRAISTSPFAASLIAGRKRLGKALGHGYVLVGDDVLAVTQPGGTRMPNGIEADLDLSPGEVVTVGEGELRTANDCVTAGPSGTLAPLRASSRGSRCRPRYELVRLAGRGPGLTPLGDDILVGYLGAAALAGDDVTGLAECAARRTTALSSTLLRLAARGELPEPVHTLLEQGDPEPFRSFGPRRAKAWRLGIALYRGGSSPALQ